MCFISKAALNSGDFFNSKIIFFKWLYEGRTAIIQIGTAYFLGPEIISLLY
jgi:hypothetical protein